MLLNNRIIFSDNGTLNDFSISLNDFKALTETLPFVATEDYLYIGSDLPFNHRWFEISTPNASGSVLSVDLWDGDTWEPVVEVIDQTAVSGVPFAQSGIISWVPDKEETWLKDDTAGTSTTVEITGLGSVIIYDMYWARFRYSADLDAGTALKYVGHKFSNDSDLSIEYPELLISSVLDQFQSGKTDWKDQQFKAAEDIIRELKRKRVVKSGDQILNWDIFTAASVHANAAIVYKAFGDDFKDQKAAADVAFKKAMDLVIYEIDKDNNARRGGLEKRLNTGWMTR